MKNFRTLIAVFLSIILITACGDDDNPVDSQPVISSSFEFSGELKSFSDISFQNKSENADTFTWDFGDNTTSSLENPTKVYEEYGNYTVQLTAENSETGEKDIYEATLDIKPGKIFFNKVSVVKCPFSDQNGSGWDLSTGPDLFFIMKQGNFEFVNTRSNYIEDVTPQMLPVYWGATNPVELQVWDTDYSFEVYDHDTSGDDLISTTGSFKLNEIILEGYLDVITVKSDNENTIVEIEVTWK